MSPTMPSLSQWALLGIQGWCIGILASAVFFALLWLTLQRMPTVRRPAGFLVLSFVLRMVWLLGVFTVLAVQGEAVGFARLLGALVGFWSVRRWAIARLRPSPSVCPAPGGSADFETQDRWP